MKKPLTANLNDKYILEICDSNTEGAFNGGTFEANTDWVLYADKGERYSPSSRYNFYTIFGNEKNGNTKKYTFALGTPRAAIQTVLMTLVPNTKFRDISFLIIDTGKEVSKVVEKEDEELADEENLDESAED